MNDKYSKTTLLGADRVVEPYSWVGHIPFAFWLIDNLKPKLFVELGTHTGNSYFAFCQAVKSTQGDTKCIAVDTWGGDEHAGYYGDDIYNDVDAYNKENYVTFSELKRKTFDEALDEVRDSTVDLLHIDGLHTYDAVKHDFETWLPKMSNRGVIIFHDVCERSADFGVWKLWDELKDRYPSVLFQHSHGLGVLAVGSDVPVTVKAFIDAASEDDVHLDLFSRLGDAVMKEPLMSVISGLRDEIGSKNGEIISWTGKSEALQRELDSKSAELGNLKADLEKTRQDKDLLANEVQTIYSTISWRITAPLRFATALSRKSRLLAKAIRRFIKNHKGLVGASKRLSLEYKAYGFTGFKKKIIRMFQNVGMNSYAEWISRYEMSADDRNAYIEDVRQFTATPLVSIVMPVYNAELLWLDEAVNSVKGQLYENWELCIADDASTDRNVRSALERLSEECSKIKVDFRKENGHISAASNSALKLVKGEWIVLLDQDDLLSEDALYWLVKAINTTPDAMMIYSDEDKIDEFGERSGPYFKSEWNPDLFYSHNMFSHMGAYRKDLIDDVGGFRLGFEGSQDYDLALRCSEKVRIDQIIHIPRILYHWRMHAESTAQENSAKPYAMIAGGRTLDDHFRRCGIDAHAELIGHGYRIVYDLPGDPPLVSIIIPTRNGLDVTKQCIDSIFDKTTYSNYEIILVDNGSDDPAAISYFDSISSDPRVTLIRDDGPFNYSRLNNSAAGQAKGSVLALLNNDVEVISPDWLTEMVSHALRPDIAAVGARLWYPNNTVQHGGIILGIGGWAGHAHKGMIKGDKGYMGRLSLVSDFSAVTAACMVIEKSKYDEVGGLNEIELKVACNDVDLCLRLIEAGYRNLWTPFADLYHHESVTRGYEDTPEKQMRFESERLYMRERWATLLDNDPAYSPNLTLNGEDFALAFPPRVTRCDQRRA